jgi:hypothetical protein
MKLFDESFVCSLALVLTITLLCMIALRESNSNWKSFALVAVGMADGDGCARLQGRIHLRLLGER